MVTRLLQPICIDGRGKGVGMLKDSSSWKRKRAEMEEVKGEELQL